MWSSGIVCIYIPLCLYLYSHLLWKDLRKEVIYIPLCLYLYFCVLNNPQDLYKFTFHYVYIYIPDVASYILPIAHLHSTMFIFISDQLNYLIPSDVFTFHYVYIYITPQVTSWLIPTSFTFHYVYIYMSSIPRLAFARITFTFHYVYIYMIA